MYIFRQCSQPDFNTYFDTDCFSDVSGGYEYNLFLIHKDRHGVYGLNSDKYEELQNTVNQLYNDFEYVKEHCVDYYTGKRYTYKQAMQENGLAYNSTTAHKLKVLFESCRCPDDMETLAEYLTITTGKTWDTTGVSGYSQGDYVDILYCKDIYTDPVPYGELYLGCGMEFSLTETDDNGQEKQETTVYGYFVSDSQYRNDKELKSLLCEMEGIKPEETKVFTISGQHTTVEYEYEEV